MTPTKMVVSSTKLRIRLSRNRIEVDPGTKCESRKRVYRDDENSFYNSKEKSAVPRPSKRGPPGRIEGQKVKRQKMDQKASSQCATILKCLTSHPFSCVFSKPVDPVALNIPDYFTVISQPMDLGTIETKLEKNVYLGNEEFAADVRLTFSNAMTYNPPDSGVHSMAKELERIFETKWEELEKKLNADNEHWNFMTETVREIERKIGNGTHTLQNDSLPKKSQVPQPKGIRKTGSLSERDANKVEVPKSSWIPGKFIGKDLHKGKENRNGSHRSGSVKAHASSGLVTSKCGICGDISCHCYSGPTVSSRIPGKFIGKDLHKGKENRNGSHPSGSVKAHPSSGLVASKCAICGDISCHCDSGSTLSSSDLTSEGLGGIDPHACGADASRLDHHTHCESPAWKKFDLESVLSTPVFDTPLSPKKALRAAMLKKRFADTILKAQTLLDHGNKSDPPKIKLEKERSERLQHEERARIQAQMKAARVKAEEELRQQREKAREAARAAIEKMERTVEIEYSSEILKELQRLSGSWLCYPPQHCGSRFVMEIVDKSQVEHPLERLGLFIKDENMRADEILSDLEEGEVF